MEKIIERLGRNIRTLREKRDLLQRELAEYAGVPVRTIGRIERGEVDVRIGTLEKIAKAENDSQCNSHQQHNNAGKNGFVPGFST